VPGVRVVALRADSAVPIVGAEVFALGGLANCGETVEKRPSQHDEKDDASETEDCALRHR